MAAGINNVLVVYKKSAYELYSSSPDRAARDFAGGSSPDAGRMKESHEAQQRTLDAVIAALEKEGARHREIYRGQLKETANIEGNDLVIAVGGDGTFLEVSHYLTAVPILGVNSDTNSSVGFYCAATKDNFEEIVANAARVPKTTIGRLELILDGKRIPEPVLNDILVAHTNPAAMTRYALTADGVEQHCKSSGLLVCTAAGSTAWMYNEGGTIMPLSSTMVQYLSRGVRGEKPGFADKLAVRSLTREGAIFVDGDHIRYEFTLGSALLIAKGPPLTVVGDLEKKREKYA